MFMMTSAEAQSAATESAIRKGNTAEVAGDFNAWVRKGRRIGAWGLVI
jgi:hypothetical protein